MNDFNIQNRIQISYGLIDQDKILQLKHQKKILKTNFYEQKEKYQETIPCVSNIENITHSINLINKDITYLKNDVEECLNIIVDNKNDIIRINKPP